MKQVDFFVYELWVDGEDLPFYVGKSKAGRHRLHDHLSRARRGCRGIKFRRIRKAITDGLRVEMREVYRTADEQAAFAEERRLIALYGRTHEGGCLTNATDGGEGACGITDETRALRYSKIKGIKHPPRSEEFKRQCAERVRGRKHSAETLAKMSLQRKGRKLGPQSVELKQKLSALRRGRPRSPEAVAKTAESNRGKKRSAETRRKMSVAHLATWARRRAEKAANQTTDA